ncbi:MAG: hypothetical protein FJ410_02690 [Verrucomicrobia bacterium]|nr:hypothetical protein [Verrucomicrobiota bacterium]
MEGRFHTFAFPLTALVDASKVEPGVSDLRMLAKQLGRWFSAEFSLTHKGVTIEGTPNGAVFIIAGIEESHWPKMIALAQTQSCALFLVIPDGNGAHQLKALEVPPA